MCRHAGNGNSDVCGKRKTPEASGACFLICCLSRISVNHRFAILIKPFRVKIGAVCPANEALPLRQAADGTFDEALSALTMLGFARQASEKALRALRKEMPAATVEELVRQALKRL